MQILWKNILCSRLTRTIASILFYLALMVLLQATAPAAANWGAEKNQIGWSATLFTLTMSLLGYSRRAFLSFFAFLALYLSIPFLEAKVGMAVNGIELTKTASLATILWASTSATTYLQIFLPRNFQKILRIPLALLCLPLLFYPLLFWGYYVLNQEFLSVDTVLAIFQTNPSEAVAYLQNFHSSLPLLFAVTIFSLLIASFKCVAPPPMRLKNKIAFLFLIAIFFISGAKLPAGMDCIAGGLITTTKAELDAYKNYGISQKERAKKLARSAISLSQKRPGIYLLILGESETRDHMSVYGYTRKTTPWLEELRQNPAALIFEKAYANQAATVPNLTFALSEKNQYNNLPLSEAYSLIETAKAAGYTTYWISNQFRWGAHDTPINIIASSADKQIWINNRSGDIDNSSFYDEKLTDVIPDLSKEIHALVIIHLMGSHWTYIDRYPQNYNRFSGEDYLVDTYDDTILYNDHVLRRLSEAMKKYPSFKGWVYISDHGEDVDHHLGHDASHFTWTMVRIPLIMQFTPDFIEENPEIFETLSSHKNHFWTNDLLYNLMLTILGIESTPNPEPHLDLASPAYDRTRENTLTLHGKKHISAEN